MDKTTFPFPKGEVFRVEGSKVNAEMSEMTDSGDIFYGSFDATGGTMI